MTRAAKPINVKTLENKFRLSAISPPFLPFLLLFLSQFVHFIPLRRSTYLHLICGAAHDCYMQITDYPLQERLGDQWQRPVKLLSTFSQPQHDAGSRERLSVLLCLCN